MLRSLMVIGLVWLATALPALAEKQDSLCVQTYLIDLHFLTGSADGTLGPKSIKAADAFVERMGLGEMLPALSVETAPDWCAFFKSTEATEIIELASLTLYDVAIDNLPAIDDGIGPLLFNFAGFKLASRFDGVSCTYAMKATFADGNGHTFVAGNLEFADGGHVIFTNSKWETGGLATPDTFNRANLAITDKEQLVGMMPVFHLFAQEGGIPPEAVVVTLEPKRSELSGDAPQGKVTFDIGTERGEMSLRCQGANGPVKIAFDFSPYRLATGYSGYQCNAQIVSVFEDSGIEDRSGQLKFKIDARGKINVEAGEWLTGGPVSSFKEANLAVTKDRKIVGVMDLYPFFPDPDPHPPVTVTLNGTQGKLDEALKGSLDFRVNRKARALLNITTCRPPA